MAKMAAELVEAKVSERRRRRGPGGGGAVRGAPHSWRGGRGAACGAAGRRGRDPDAGWGCGRGGGETGGGVASTHLECPRRLLSLHFQPELRVPTRPPRRRHCPFLWDSPTGTDLGGVPCDCLPSPRHTESILHPVSKATSSQVRVPHRSSPAGQHGETAGSATGSPGSQGPSDTSY